MSTARHVARHRVGITTRHAHNGIQVPARPDKEGCHDVSGVWWCHVHELGYANGADREPGDQEDDDVGVEQADGAGHRVRPPTPSAVTAHAAGRAEDELGC